jgi:LPXTG-motif cell wall-anchored protein
VGDTEVTVETLNPSNDDNLFMAFFYLKNVEITGATDAIPSALADTGADTGQLALLGGLAALSMVAGAAVVVRRRKA